MLLLYIRATGHCPFNLYDLHFSSLLLKKIVFLLNISVKFGWSDALADIEYFFAIPRTISEVETEGWQRMERPPGPLPELRMYCPPGRGVCPLYDTAGFVAGLMIAVSLIILIEKRKF